MKTKNLLFILILAATCINAAAQRRQPQTDGYPLSNFSLTVNAPLNGDLFGPIMKNPGRLGDWLQQQGAIPVLIEKNHKSHHFADFGVKTVNRRFPFVRNTYAQSPLITSTIEAEAFCPLGINDVETSSLPVLMLELKISATRSEQFNIIIMADSVNCKVHAKNLKTEGDRTFIPVDLKVGEIRTVRIAIEFHDDNQVYDNWFTYGEAGTFALRQWNILKDRTVQFSRAIPATGDAALDEYLRWYMVPGIALTRCTRNGEALTMGYCELNQRDSYWTSWIHLLLFKDLERKMLEESVQYQQPSGKIPTTILPLIERHDDLDINAFFILREARYYRLYHDRAALAADWDAMKKAMDWLIDRDKSGNGLPEQISFWGDWKDVTGVAERRYSPFSGLIYLAALKEMIFMSGEHGDAASIDRYKAAYDKGHDFINRPTSQGGLWNGQFYCQIFKDGSVNEHLLQDQTIGILFGVVPADRAEKIITALNAQSLTEFGIAETTPYYPEEFGYKPATYHNGAVWPWLSFMDCWARIKADHKAEAIELVKKVAKADLVDSGDWSPNEHINSLTGENLGFILQGWNAGLFGVVYFGMLNPGIVIP